MSTPAPWHQVVTLREDLLSGELALNLFAADLYEVAVQSGERPLYEDPALFFARTHATRSMRDLVGDVAACLDGRSDKAVRKLALTYGGGKTHTLITLLHLFGRAGSLPDLPAVAAFRQAITQATGGAVPRARVATVAFDKLDVHKGMEALSPTGERRQLHHPWSVLVYQLAGDDGLRELHADGLAEERESPPTEQYLKAVLQAPAADGLATLVLFDEVLIYARNKAQQDSVWRKRTVDFFQALTQAVAKTDRAALVVSLLANDLKADDLLGRTLAAELEDIVSRQREEDVQPVEKRDVARVLRQQFFTPESLADEARFRPHAHAAAAAVANVDERTARRLSDEEERYTASYPFHPELTEVFYQKWTGIEQFQQTRGVLRTFALALREAAQWDAAPLVGPNVFLAAPGEDALSPAARELATTARNATVAQGDKVAWPNILESELGKARDIQEDQGTLSGREIEQAVVAVFLHSQPALNAAGLGDLLALVGHTDPIKIELEKGLKKWARTSWYLDDDRLDAWASSDDALPQEWRLGGRPNLRQMHDHARERLVKEDDVGVVLDNEAAAIDPKGASLGLVVHKVPDHPRKIEDDPRLHLATLGPKAASEPGRVSPYAHRFLTTHTSDDKPRVYRNNLLLVAPTESGLVVARNAIRDWLAWEHVKELPEYRDMPPLRVEQVVKSAASAKEDVPHAVGQAYCLVVTTSETSAEQAFKVAVTSEPLATTIKNDPRARVAETAIEPAALLPDGPYGVWPDDQPTVPAQDLVDDFFRYPRLPKLLSPDVVRDTLVQGARSGTFALRYTRGDGSVRTYWLEAPDPAALADGSLEAVLPAHAELPDLSPALLDPGRLPGLWDGDVTLGDLYAYFGGGHVVQRPVGDTGFTEPLDVPRAEPTAVQAAVVQAVEEGRLWLATGTASLWRETPPAGVLTDAAALRSPPEPIAAADLLPEALPEAWADGTATARSFYDALQDGREPALPWTLVAQAIHDAIHARVLEPTDGPVVAWPLPYEEAAGTRFTLPGTPADYPQADNASPTWREPTAPNVRAAEAELGVDEVQDLADIAPEILEAAAGHGVRFTLRVALGDGRPVPADVVDRVASLLADVNSDLDLS